METELKYISNPPKNLNPHLIIMSRVRERVNNDYDYELHYDCFGKITWT